MDFFKSVFSEDPDPSTTELEPNSPDNKYTTSDSAHKHPESNADPNLGAWSFGGLIRTLTTRSESVMESYRRDLQEFGSGLKKEIEVAHGSIGTLGSAIDEFGSSVLKGTAQIIAQGKEVILAGDDEPDSSSDKNSDRYSAQQSLNSKGYSRFDSQVRVLQGDINTYCEEPEDLEDYSNWRRGFVLEEKREETEELFEENGDMKSLYDKVVPNSVDHVTFWCRYFYKVFKLKQAEDLRANIVKRAISQEDEEDLSWDVDDDEEREDDRNVTSKASLNKVDSVDSKGSDITVEVKEISMNSQGDSSVIHELSSKHAGETLEEDEGSVEEPEVVKSEVVEDKQEEPKTVFDAEAEVKRNGESTIGSVPTEEVNLEKSEKNNGMDKEESASKSNEKMAVEEKAENEESTNSNGKDSDFLVVSSHRSLQEEEDLDWDEIEDLSRIDDKKMEHGGSSSTNRVDLRKRISAPEEEEDLSWDIEDDDEPAKLEAIQ